MPAALRGDGVRTMSFTPMDMMGNGSSSSSSNPLNAWELKLAAIAACLEPWTTSASGDVEALGSVGKHPTLRALLHTLERRIIDVGQRIVTHITDPHTHDTKSADRIERELSDLLEEARRFDQLLRQKQTDLTWHA